jgi:cleavage and polyadenylation specificity factor subunit 2
LLITDAFNADYDQARRRLRDEQLMSEFFVFYLPDLLSRLYFIFSATILHTMRNDGNCLVALDTAGRVLELAHLLVCVIWKNCCNEIIFVNCSRIKCGGALNLD